MEGNSHVAFSLWPLWPLWPTQLAEVLFLVAMTGLAALIIIATVRGEPLNSSSQVQGGGCCGGGGNPSDDPQLLPICCATMRALHFFPEYDSWSEVSTTRCDTCCGTCRPIFPGVWNDDLQGWDFEVHCNNPCDWGSLTPRQLTEHLLEAHERMKRRGDFWR